MHARDFPDLEEVTCPSCRHKDIGPPALLSSDPHRTSRGLLPLLACALLAGARPEFLLAGPTGCDGLPSPLAEGLLWPALTVALSVTNRNGFLNKGFLRYPDSDRPCLLRPEVPPNYDIFLCSPLNIFNIQTFML